VLSTRSCKHTSKMHCLTDMRTAIASLLQLEAACELCMYTAYITSPAMSAMRAYASQSDMVSRFFFVKDAFECEAETCSIPVRLLHLSIFMHLIIISWMTGTRATGLLTHVVACQRIRLWLLGCLSFAWRAQ
jgi:hypothetical protein